METKQHVLIELNPGSGTMRISADSFSDPDDVLGTKAQRRFLASFARVIAVGCLGSAVAGGTIALGIWIGLRLDEKHFLLMAGLLSYAVIPAIGVFMAGAIVALWTERLPKGLFLTVFAIAYVIIGVGTFTPSAPNLPFNDLAAEYIVHWAVVGAVMIPGAWLIGKFGRTRSR